MSPFHPICSKHRIQININLFVAFLSPLLSSEAPAVVTKVPTCHSTSCVALCAIRGSDSHTMCETCSQQVGSCQGHSWALGLGWVQTDFISVLSLEWHVGLPGLCLAFSNTKLFSKMAKPFYLPTTNIWGFQFNPILTSSWQPSVFQITVIVVCVGSMVTHCQPLDQRCLWGPRC